MKMLRKILMMSMIVAGLSLATYAQKDKNPPPPKEKPPVINPGSKNPPPPPPKKKPGGEFEAIWVRQDTSAKG